MVVFRPCSKAGTAWEGNTSGMVPSDKFPCLSSSDLFCWHLWGSQGKGHARIHQKCNSCAEWKNSISMLVHLFVSKPKPSSCSQYIRTSFMPNPALDKSNSLPGQRDPNTDERAVLHCADTMPPETGFIPSMQYRTPMVTQPASHSHFISDLEQIHPVCTRDH